MLIFSPHNQQIVGNRIYLSHYHGGVYVLDATAAFAGRKERPTEAGFMVPSDPQTRPVYRRPAVPFIPTFFSEDLKWRPSIWDMSFYKGHILAADMIGGFYSLQYEGDAAGACSDGAAPRSRFLRRKSRVGRNGVRLRGRARDRGCGGTRRVQVSVARKVGGRCAFLRRNGRFTRARSCRRALYLKARGNRRWRLRRRVSLPAGTYVVRVRAVDTAGNRERRTRKRNKLVRRVS